jgi:hypothetical protein
MCPNQILNVRMCNVLCHLKLSVILRNLWLMLWLLLLDSFGYLLRAVSLYQVLHIRVSCFFCDSALRLLTTLGLGLLFLDRAISLNQTMHIAVSNCLFHRSLRGRDLPLVRDTTLSIHGPLLGHWILILLSRPLGCLASPKMSF